MATEEKSTTPRRAPRVILGAAAVLVLWLIVGGVGGQFFGKLSSVQDNDNASYLPASAESTKVAKQLGEFSDSSSLPLIVVIESQDKLTAAQLGQIQAFAASLPKLAIHDKTVLDYLATPQAIAVPSADGMAALVVLSLDDTKANEEIDGESPINLIVGAIRDQIAKQFPADSKLTGHVTGPAGFVADLVTAFAGIDGILLVVALVVVLIILLIVYRSPILPIAVLLTAVFGLAAAGLVIYPVAKNGWLTLSGQSQGILSILVVGAATDYSLLLVSRYKEELHDHESTWKALKIAWRASVEPILASGGTVILGLLMLMFASLKGTSGLGPIAALAIVGALLAALTFLPAMLVLGRRWIFWPMIPKADHIHASQQAPGRFSWARVAGLVGRWPRRIWVITTLALVVAAMFLPTLRANGIPQSGFFLTDVDSVTGQKVLAKHFEAGSGSPIQLIVPEKDLPAVMTKLGSTKGITDPVAGLVPGQSPKVVNGNVVVQATLTELPDTREAQDIVQQLRTDLDTISPDILVGGETAQNLDTRLGADRDLLVVAPLIVLVVFIVLALLLRSLAAALMLVLANVLSFAATMGIAAVMFNHVFKFPGADPTTVLYGFVFLVALGVDYSIFLMTRAREEAKVIGTDAGMLAALRVTGGVITSAGIVLAATFSALSVVPLLFLAEIAFIVAFGVLLDTLVVRSLLVPSLTVDIGPKIWWPSKLSRGIGIDLSDDSGTAHADTDAGAPADQGGTPDGATDAAEPADTSDEADPATQAES